MKILKSLFVIITLVAITGGVTTAYFTSSITAQSNQVNTGTFQLTLNGSNGPTMGPALRGKNMYPGTFVQSAGLIGNGGTIALNPSISLANASDPKGMLPYLWLQIWSNGKLWYNNWLNQAPGYTTGKITLDTIAPGAGSTAVAFRFILDESAPQSVQGGTYQVNTVVTGYQTNDPAGSVTSYTGNTQYKTDTFSYPTCGIRPASSYYSYDETAWKDLNPANHLGIDGVSIGSDAGGYYCQLP